MPRRSLTRRLLPGLAAAAILIVAAWTAAAAEKEPSSDLELFENKVRPLLVEKCHKCHGPDAAKPKGGLRVDSREALLHGGTRGPAVVPGDPARSLLARAVRRESKDLEMPPDAKLPPADIALLEAWIEAGAPFPARGPGAQGPTSAGLDMENARRRWTFQPVRDPPPPAVTRKDWVLSPIDAFILEALEARGLEPAPRADRRTLLRRASFDLTGLPPSMEEVEAFAADARDDAAAFRAQVERLLASPRYGERWGRHWLDLARFADTKGYVYDRDERRFVGSSVYRDWVIRSFNEDVPYDRFLLEQIAGDQLAPDPGGDRRDLAAMGFLTLGRRFLGVVHDIIDDRIDTVFRATQALTVACARCHDHKFDPIPTRDYYSLYGVFAGSTERLEALEESPAHTPAYDAFAAELKKRVDALDAAFQKKREEVSVRLRAQATRYLIALLDVESLPNEEFYSFYGPEDVNPVVVRQWQGLLLQAQKRFDPVFAPWVALAAIPEKDVPERAPALLAAMAGVNVKVGRALLEPAPPRDMHDVAERYGALFAGTNREWLERAGTASKAGAAPPAALDDPDLEALRRVLYGPDSPASVPNGAIADVEWFFEESARVELAKLEARIEAHLIDAPGAPPYAMVLEDRPVQRTSRVFVRGNPARKGEEAPRRFLEVLAGPARKPFERGSGRLELARAIASRDNPLTARVMANRVWLGHFGQGIVSTPSDFGARAEPPSHPELLDFLASRFVEGGWSLKRLHALLMVSSTYMQSSDASPASLQGDPEGRLYSRMPRARLDLESLRDALLAATGELDLAMGGRAADLFQRPFSTRRTVYGYVDRQFLPGVYRAFDFANPDQHTPERHATTVPQQALFLLNHPFAVERAKALAARPGLAAAITSPAGPAERVRGMYRRVFQRDPSAGEIAAGVEFVAGAPSRTAPEPPRGTLAWSYGFGELDETSRRMKSFEPLPHFAGEAWQGAAEYPAATLGWVQLTRSGGHAGNDLAHAAVRRWTAPADGKVSVRGSIVHAHAEGDGIAARIVSSRHGLLAAWWLHDQRAEVALDPIEVRQGDTLDFVVDIRGALGWDDFAWAPVIAGAGGDWDAARDFSGPARPALGAWDAYAQALLLSNEFLFVD